MEIGRPPARITAAIQSRTGADIILMAHNWPHLYRSALADVSDLCEWKAKDQGGYYPQSAAAAREGRRWLALPYDLVGLLIACRTSWFATQPPRTLDEYMKIGAALKRRGRPVGQTLGHTLGDAPAWAYPLLWAFGGAETDPSGKRVVINSKGARESVRWMVAFWREACDEGALAWDDTNNNRAFHADEISATLNGASIYIFAKRKIRHWVALVVSIAIVALAGAPAEAQLPKHGTYTSKFGWYAIGKVFELEKDHVFFVGEFSGTNFNDEGRGFLHDASVVCPGSNDIKAPGSAQGYCIVTDSDGDKAFLVWKCTSDRPGGKCDGDFQWTGGSGKYTGLRGNNRFYGVTILPTSSGYAVWKGEWELP